MSDQTIPPTMMVRSFLTVGSGFVLFVVGFLSIAALLGYLFFPEYLAFLGESDEVQKEIMANNPEKAIPRNMFLALVALNVVSCFLLGVYAFATSPFSHFAHVIFLAGLLFIYFLQMANADPPGKKSMTMIYLFAFPIAILIGGKFADSRARAAFARTNLEEEASDSVDG